mgnify:CR=1 FL=1
MGVNLAVAFGLFLIFEGLLPFVVPNFYKRVLMELAQVQEKGVRGFGFILVLTGALCIYFSL